MKRQSIIEKELDDIELYNGHIWGAIQIINESIENNDTDDEGINKFTFFHLSVMNTAIECFHDKIHQKLEEIDKKIN